MKKSVVYLAVLLVVTMSWGCNTAGGILKGAGKDLQSAGEWIEPKPRNRDR